MLMAMIVLVVLSGAIFFGQSVRTSMEQASECIEYASSADATAGTSEGGAAMQVEEEKKSGSLADRLAALLDTSDDGEGPQAGSNAAAGGRGKPTGTPQNPGKCPD